MMENESFETIKASKDFFKRFLLPIQNSIDGVTLAKLYLKHKLQLKLRFDLVVNRSRFIWA